MTAVKCPSLADGWPTAGQCVRILSLISETAYITPWNNYHAVGYRLLVSSEVSLAETEVESRLEIAILVLLERLYKYQIVSPQIYTICQP